MELISTIEPGVDRRLHPGQVTHVGNGGPNPTPGLPH